MNGFAALGDPTRRRIIELIGGKEVPAGDIARDFKMSAPAISQHLKILREARLIRMRVEAQRRLYAVEPAGFAELEQWLSQVRSFWNPRLDKLEKELKRAAARRKKKI